MTAKIKLYLVIGGVVLLLCLVSAVVYFSNKVDALETEREVTAALLKATEERITALTQQDINKIDDESLKRLERIENAIDRIDASTARTSASAAELRNSYTRLLNSGNTITPQECREAVETLIMHSNVFGECRQTVGTLGVYADQLEVSGDSARDSYNAVRARLLEK